MNSEQTKAFIKKLTEKEESAKKYYYEVLGGSYVEDGHYWNNDIHAYTPEGDRTVEVSGWTSPICDDWDELLTALDEEYFLVGSVEELNPEELTAEIDKEGRKVLYSFEVEREETDEDEMGHYWEGTVYYDVIICEV